MRQTQFEGVWQATLRRMGIDPLGQAVRYDTARAIVEHINNAVEYAWTSVEWPELMLTQERAFRARYNATTRYRRARLVDGLPDELFYLTDSSYYRVNPAAVADPPAGTLPTDVTYFEPLDPFDSFIALDTVGEQSIGDVFGVYGANPRVQPARGYKFRSSERGIDVQRGALPTVWLHYRLRPSRFSLVPYADGHAYKFRDLIYDAASGECYQAVNDNTGLPPSSPTYWRKVPFPLFLRSYVIAQAAANALREWDPAWSATTGSASLIQIRLALADRLEAEGARYLEREYIRLKEHGHHSYYTLANRAYRSLSGWCASAPCFNGSPASTTEASSLTDQVFDEWGRQDEDIQNDMQTQGLLLPLVNGQAYLDFAFADAKVDGDGNPTTEWELENALIENTDDSDPLLLFFNISNRTPSGGRILLSAAPDSDNYKFRARVRVPLQT